MGKSVSVMTLTSAIGLALMGAGLQISADAYAAGVAPLAQSAQAQRGATSGVQSYIITFTEAGLLHYNGGVGALQATAPRATESSRKLDVHSSSAVAYSTYLRSQREQHEWAISNALGRTLTPTHVYAVTINGIAAELSASEAAQVAKLPGVKSVYAAGVQYMDTYRGPTFIGADQIWNGSATPTGAAGATRGKGILVADIDGGTNSAHPSFANDPSCGFRESQPKLVAVDCSTTDINGFCNGPNPEATPGDSGHGVHTSSTVAGNTIDNTVTPAPTLPDGVTMSGVAPCAAIHQYKVCETNTCDGDAIAAAIQNAIADQADVLNFSISGGTSPWNDNDRFFLDAVNADVFVAASAGNTRTETPNPVGQVNHLGPWMMTVAASTQDQIIGPQLTVTGPGTVPPALMGIKLTPGNTTDTGETPNLTGQKLLSYPTNVTGCTADGGFPANYFSDAIAVVRRGTCSFVEKITNAAGAGADVVIIANNQPGTLSMDTTAAPDVPAFSINQTDGDALLAFLAPLAPPAPDPDVIFANGFDESSTTTYGAVGDYNRAVQSATQGDVLANFSFRGPTPAVTADSTKPDITGPGVNIYAALGVTDGNYGFLSGTSMSSPHVTGAAALVRAVHPDWTVPEVKSAMMMTATNANGVQEDGVTPWTIDQVGSGRIDLTKAALAGLTMNETYANFVAADPSALPAGDVKTLNLPLLRNTLCNVSCSWTRTFKNRLATPGTWDVTFATDPSFTMTATPANFTLAPGATQTVTFQATVANAPALVFGNAILTEAAAQSPAQHVTIAIKSPPPKIQVTPTALSSTQATNTTATQPLNVANIGGGTLNWSFTANGVGTLWNQPRSILSGLPSTYSTADSAGGFIAADFQTAGAVSLTKIAAEGFDNTSQLAGKSVTWRIYADAAGKPDGNPDSGAGNLPVWTYTAAVGATGVTTSSYGTISLDLVAAGQTLNLPAGTFWLSVAPTYANPYVETSTAGPWYWFGAVQQGAPGLVVGDYVYDATDWATFTDVDPGTTFTDAAFSIQGSVPCGASWLALAPTSDSLAGGASTAVTATFDSAGLADGTYNAVACITSNDATNPLVTIPVTLTVAANSDCVQPLVDPSFETTDGTTFANPSWPSTDSRSGTPLCTAAGCGGGLAKTGDWFVWFGGWSSGTEIGNFSQAVTFPSGSDHWLNFNMLRTVAGASATTSLVVTIDGTTLATYPKPTASDSAYIAYSLPIPSALIDGAVHTVKFSYSKSGGGATGNTFIDDITIDCAATPTGVSGVISSASELTNALRSIR